MDLDLEIAANHRWVRCFLLRLAAPCVVAVQVPARYWLRHGVGALTVIVHLILI